MKQEFIYPDKELFKDAAINSMDEYYRLQNFAKNDYEGFWDSFAKKKITWKTPYTKVLDESNMPFVRWFEGGELNVSEQCIDRHLKDKGDKTAILFQCESGTPEKLATNNFQFMSIKQQIF